MTGKYLSLSSLHVTPETFYSIEDMMDRDGFPAHKKEEYGYFVWVFPEEVRGPEDLCDVLYYAIEHGCDLLIIEHNGSIIDDLPTYTYSWDEFDEREVGNV